MKNNTIGRNRKEPEMQARQEPAAFSGERPADAASGGLAGVTGTGQSKAFQPLRPHASTVECVNDAVACGAVRTGVPLKTGLEHHLDRRTITGSTY